MKMLIVLILFLVATEARASDLDDYLKSENITIPDRIQRRIEELNLVPMFGMTVPASNCEESYFLIEYCHNDDVGFLFEPCQVDELRKRTVMRLKYHKKKCKYIMEYACFRKVWGSISFEAEWTRIDFSFL